MTPIKGYEGRYAIDSDFKIRNVKSGKSLKFSINADGYPIVGLLKDRIQTQFFVHRLIAIEFVPNPNNKPFVNHKDGVKTNFHPDNLEWVTCSENMRHAYKLGLQVGYGVSGEEHGKARLTLDLTTGIYYGCLKHAAEARGLNSARIRAAIHDGRNKSGIVYV